MSIPTRPSRWILAADAIVLGLCALALGIRLFGGFRIDLGVTEIAARSPLRLLVLALALTALTWIADRARAPWRRWQAHGDRLALRYPALADVLPVVLSTRALVLLIGFLAVKVIGFPPLDVQRDTIWPDDFINLPWRWDTGWYTQIAVKGYAWNVDPTLEQPIVFFPAYPILMRLTATLLLSADSDVMMVWSGVLVSWIAFVCAAVYVHRLARELIGERAAAPAVLFLTLYPFATFYSTAYSEALFLLVNAAAFWHFRHRQFLRAGLFGLVAGLTRPNGCLLSAALFLVLVLREWPRDDAPSRQPAGARSEANARVGLWLRGLAAAAMPGIGLLIYCGYMWHLTGDPLVWMKSQQAWHRDIHLGDPRLARQLASPRFLLDTAALVFTLASIWPIARRLGVSYAAWTAVNVLLPFLNGGVLSVGRFTAVLFPLFILIGGTVPERWRPLACGLFALLQGLVTAAFFTYRPLY